MLRYDTAVPLRYVALNYVKLHCAYVTLRNSALFEVKSCFIIRYTLYNTLSYVSLRYITLCFVV